MKKTITEIESIIEERIAELEEEYELDIYDRNDIREEEYKKAAGSTTHSQRNLRKKKPRKRNGTTAAWRNSSTRSA